MKKSLFKMLLAIVFVSSYALNVKAQCGPDQSELYLTTSGGNFPSEKWVQITTEADGAGTVVWAQGNGTYGNGAGLLTNEPICVDNGVTLYLNAYDAYADSWDSTIYELKNEYGNIVINNNGASPDDDTNDDISSLWGDTQAQELEVSESFSYTPPTCPGPNTFTVAVTTANSTDLGWTETGSATTWNIEWGATDFTQGLGTIVTGTMTNPHNLTGLIPATDYEFYVQADCTGGDLSTWNGPFEFTTLESCISPSNLDAVNITSDGAELSWTENGTSALWNIEYGDAGYTLGAGTMVTGTDVNPHVLTGLNSNTEHDFYVQADCGAEQSIWIGPYTFTTLCGTSTPEVSEAFDTYLPNCWERTIGILANPSVLSETYSNWKEDGFANVGFTGSARINIFGSYINEWLISPSINLGDGTTNYQIEFDLALTDYGSTGAPDMNGDDDKFAVVISNDNGVTWNLTDVLQLWDNAGSSYVYNNIPNTGEHIAIDLTGETGIVKFAFYGESTVNNADNDLFIDNIRVREIPSCTEPISLNVSNITLNEADLSWTELGTSTSWNIEWGLAGFTQGTGTTENLTETTYSLTTLLEDTEYDFYVQSDCGAEQSIWSSYTFSTSATGDDCEAPIRIMLPLNAPYADIAQTTTGRLNDYSETCLDYHDGGEDILYELNVTSDVVVDITLDPKTTPYTGILIADQCPDASGTCIQSSTSYNTSTHGFTAIPLAAGTYFIMISSYDGSIPEFDLFIDVITCPNPIDQTIDNILQNSADLFWSEIGDAVAWNIEWDTTGFAQGTGTIVPITDTTCSLTGLLDSTNYQFYVQADCSGGDLSEWVGPFGFTTLDACAYPTDLDVVNIGETTADLTWNGYNATNWDIEYGEAPYTATGIPTVDDHTSSTLSLTGLTSYTSYEFYVRADCGGVDTTVWAGPYTFNTLMTPLTNPTPCGVGYAITGGMLDIPISVTGVTDLLMREVNFIAPHTWDSDLEISLESPNGVIVDLSIGNGGSGDNYGAANGTCTQHTNFFMYGPDGPITGGSAPFIGSYIPEGDFADFNDGSDPNGIWILHINDTYSFDDDGTFEFAELVFGSPSTDADILTYSMAEQFAPAVIDDVNNTVVMQVGNSYALTDLIATFTLSLGATSEILTVAQESGVTSNDFTTTLIYVVTAEDGTTTQDWLVTVTEAPVNTATDILTFSFPEETGDAVINSSAQTIDIEVNWEADLTNLTATFTLSYGANATIATNNQVSGATSNDFSGVVTYLITAEDGSTTQEWDVTVTQAGIPQGVNCSDPIPLTLPAENITGNTAGFGDDYDSGMVCGSSYMNGDDIVYEFTISEEGFLDGSMTTNDSYLGMFILDSCPDIATECFISSTSYGQSTSFNNEPITPGDYFLIISSWPTPQSIDFDFNLSWHGIPTSDSLLVDLLVNGTSIPGFDPTVFTYIVEVPADQPVPDVTYVLSDVNATVVQEDATSVPGTTTIEVTAENGTSISLYSVIFTMGDPSTDATLSDLTVDGETVDGFDPAIYTYNVGLPSETTVVPAVAYTTTDANATVDQTDATELPGSTIVVVTAQDELTELTYTVNFTIIDGVDDVNANSNISVYPNPNDGLFNVNISIPVQNNIELQLLNVHGQVINIYSADNVTEFSKEIDVTELSKGVYFLKINTGNQIKVKKVIVK